MKPLKVLRSRGQNQLGLEERWTGTFASFTIQKLGTASLLGRHTPLIGREADEVVDSWGRGEMWASDKRYTMGTYVTPPRERKLSLESNFDQDTLPPHVLHLPAQ